MNKEYKIKLDLNKKLYNKKMAFNQFDENVNDFYIEITKNNEIVKDLDKAIVVLAVIKPNKEVDSQFVEVENGVVYANLKPSMKDEIGIYTAKAMLILEDERVVTDSISYEVKEDKVFSLLNDTVETTEEFTLLTDMLSRLSTIELNENNREETFNNIKDEFEIIKNNHNELVTAKTDNKVAELLDPVVSKANEKINEVDNKIIDIENAISEADNKINNAIAKIPPKSELIGEKGDKGEKGEKGDKGDRGEQGLQGIQGIQGIQGERGLQGVKGDKGDKGEQGIQGLKGDKGDKGDRGEQGVKGDTPSITHLETSINNKIQEVETRFNTLTSSQQQASEVIDARDGETSLKARLDRDIEKAKEIYVPVEGSNISTDSSSGYTKDVEILGNTIQDASNLADIRSVGDKVEGQELYEIPVLSRGKNLLDSNILFANGYIDDSGNLISKMEQISTSEKIKVDSNKTYVLRNNMVNVGANIMIREFDVNGKLINKSSILPTVFFTTSNNTTHISFNFYRADSDTYLDNARLQLEEGTQPTPYEPYQEDKLTILSPTPLEKVGDVRDRIIEKDGVWGVEKNIGIKYLKDINFDTRDDRGTYYRLGNYGNTFPMMNTDIISDKYTIGGLNTESTQSQIMCYHHSQDKKEIRLAIQKIDVPNISNVTDLLNSIKKDNSYIKYVLNNPQFIPLPHDQQVKLRTFANKTNISFGCEIEGTIKAQVPKSLGATVNTHTEQINNLNKELDRVKKLEESTVSTVTTESDFTTVEATSNGYFEDVKLEGKTLVNKIGELEQGYVSGSTGESLASSNRVRTKKCISLGDSITIITNFMIQEIICFSNDTFVKSLVGANINKNIYKVDKSNDFNQIKVVFKKSTNENVLPSEFKNIILEGDHTQNPPSYFEGLKSVGQGTDEIVVSSCNNIKEFKHNKVTSSLVYDFDITDIVDNNFDLFNPFSYKLKVIINDAVTNKWKRDIINLGHGVHNIKLNDDEKVIKVRGVLADGWHSVNSEDFFNKICFSYNFNQDKKRLLFYNNETQTWEKPILREWDSIEKHANGKYYYHQRSGEVVLNGSENWVNEPTYTTDDIYGCYLMKSSLNMKDWCIVISNKFPTVQGSPSDSFIKEGFNVNSGVLGLRLFKSKLSTQDVQGFKQWLQTNNITAVYQLAEEKVYECTNIDLITYANETNYVVESGAIVPRTTLKVHNNISNVVSLLQKKVSLLESNITKYMITQNRMQLASTYSADSVTFKVDYFSLCGDEENYDEDLYNLILNNILVGKDNYDYDKMFTMILDYASWNQISWEQFDILVGLMDMQHNPPVEEIPTEDEVIEEIPNEIM